MVFKEMEMRRYIFKFACRQAGDTMSNPQFIVCHVDGYFEQRIAAVRCLIDTGTMKRLSEHNLFIILNGIGCEYFTTFKNAVDYYEQRGVDCRIPDIEDVMRRISR